MNPIKMDERSRKAFSDRYFMAPKQPDRSLPLRAWRASFTTRWHTNFYLSDTRDFVSGHQGRVALLVLALFPDAPRELLAHAITHDQGEVLMGDMPQAAKATFPELAGSLALEEKREVYDQGFRIPNLTEREVRKLDLCDRLDAWLWMMRHARHLFAAPGWQSTLLGIEEESAYLGVDYEVELLLEEEALR